MTDTQNSYKDEYTILSGNNKEAIFTKGNQKILCEGTQATIISTGNEVELVDNYFFQDHKGKHTDASLDILHGDSSVFISTGNEVSVNPGKNSTVFTSGDRDQIKFETCEDFFDDDSADWDNGYNFGKTCVVVTGNEVQVEGPDNVEQSVILSTGNECELTSRKNSTCIIAGDESQYYHESLQRKTVVNLGEKSIIDAAFSLCVNLSDNVVLQAGEESIILTKSGAIIDVHHGAISSDAESVIITTWLEGDDEYAHQKIAMYNYGTDFFNKRKYKVGEKGELIDITPTK
ncbi:hypothetical protein [Proteus genomosp. 4]|uniref:hypothetical protein n=1 Tax=Proteus genomosp. 4 TaxID=1311818 RepID=UPI000D6918D2|nr:hypothetical protein [Proteus genomosp. 4]